VKNNVKRYDKQKGDRNGSTKKGVLLGERRKWIQFSSNLNPIALKIDHQIVDKNGKEVYRRRAGGKILSRDFFLSGGPGGPGVIIKIM